MPKKRLDREAFGREYSEKCPKYERLADNLKQALKRFLNDADIDVLDVVCRIKDFDSFCEKIERKGYTDPFREVEDICGLRIICYYPSDLERISQIINDEFEVLEAIDTADLLEPDRFGYRSLHFVVNVKKDWLKAPNYRGLGGLEAEIQVRTILMHAWADIQHKLAYKKKEHIPDQFRRKLHRLSALIEAADEQFEGLRKEKEEYMKGLVSKEARETGRFDVKQDMNLDSLQAFLDFYFPERAKSSAFTTELLEEIMALGLSFGDLLEGFERAKNVLPSMEREVYATLKRKHGQWNQTGVIRVILDLIDDSYWKSREERWSSFYPDMIEIVTKWRKVLSKQEN